MENIEINVYSIVNSPFCVDAADGQKVYEVIHKAFNENKKIIVSFKNVSLVITAFLNSAIGQLYKDFTPEFISNNLSVSNVPDGFEYSWKKVTEGAPIYYKNPEESERSTNEIVED